MEKVISLLALLLLPTLLLGCGNRSDDKSETTDKKGTTVTSSNSDRWYSAEQVEQGGKLYQANCAVCHMADASGTADWKKPMADGNYPPPPLNGTAHAWHHPLNVLRRTVKLGGIPLGGTMPPFDDKLSTEQIDAIVAWIQTHWSDDIYAIWLERSAK